MAECPCCHGERRKEQYLCRYCWRQLPQATRIRLNKRDGRDRARGRYVELVEALRRGRGLSEIQVSG